MTGIAAELKWDSLITSIDENRLNYNKLRGQFVRKAEEAADKFSIQYDQNIKNLDQLIEKASDLAIPCILDSVDVAVQFLLSQKMYDVDSEHFIDTFYQPHDRWTAAFDVIADSYAEIVHSAEELDTYRTSRRQGRGQIVGGGFGVGGAVKGMAMAGAANLAIGAVHGAFNLAAKGISAVGDAVKKNSIFSKPETKDSLVNALYNSVFNVHLALLDVLRNSNQDQAFQRVSSEDQDKASRMLKNLQQGRLGDADKSGVLRNVLTLDPYLSEAYEYAMTTYGDANGELENAAKFFHINLHKKKEAQIRVLINTKTEADTKVSLDKVHDAEKFLGYAAEQSIIPELEKKLQKFDTAARTVAGKVHPTREMAKSAADQLEKERQEKVDATFQTVKRGAVKTVKGIGYLIVGFIALGLALSFFIQKNEKAAQQSVARSDSSAANSTVPPPSSPAPLAPTETASPPVIAPTAPPVASTSGANESTGMIANLLKLAESNNSDEIIKVIETIDGLPKPASGERKMARQLNEQGLALLKSRDFNAAIGVFSKGVETDRSDPEVLNNLGYAFMENGNLTEAESRLIYTLTISPRRTSAWSNLSTVYARLDRQQQAVGAMLLAHRYSKNPQKTVEFLQKSINGNDPKFAEIAKVALNHPQIRDAVRQ